MHDIKEFNDQSLATQAKKGEQLVSMMLAFKKAFDLMGDDITDFSYKKRCVKKNRLLGLKWLDKCKAKLLNQVDNEKRAIFKHI